MFILYDNSNFSYLDILKKAKEYSLASFNAKYIYWVTFFKTCFMTNA